MAGFPAIVVRRALAAETPLRHLVLLMQENRSFDHYFGHFPGADGLPAGASVYRPSAACLASPPHDESALSGDANSGFPAGTALTAYTERDLPFYWSLARRFTLCDRYFASVLGPTFPNRLFSVAGSTGGYAGNPDQVDPARLPRPSLMDRLDERGVDWACYLARRPDARYNPVAYYPELQDDRRANRSYADFLADAAAGRLPSVTWVVAEDPLTEHPPAPPQWGERFAARTVSALASGPQWREAALVLNYDEGGGFYDHVTPPRVGGAGLGFRVPCTVVSPYARPGHVSHVTHDHASVLALVERVFGLAPLTARDAAATPLEDCFDFGRPTLDPIAYPASPSPSPGCGRPPDWAEQLLALPQPAPDWFQFAGLGAGLGALAAGLALGWWRRRDR